MPVNQSANQSKSESTNQLFNKTSSQSMMGLGEIVFAAEPSGQTTDFSTTIKQNNVLAYAGELSHVSSRMCLAAAPARE